MKPKYEISVNPENERVKMLIFLKKKSKRLQFEEGIVDFDSIKVTPNNIVAYLNGSMIVFSLAGEFIETLSYKGSKIVSSQESYEDYDEE